MTTPKKAGIWIDHSSAHIIEFSTDAIETKIIKSKFTLQEKELSLDKGESQMHSKEQHWQAEYYKKLGETIRNYDDVILFGPTDAKAELYNRLKKDHLFAKIKIAVKHTDNMKEQEQHELHNQFDD